MMARLPLLSISTAAVTMFYALLPSAPLPPVELRAGQVVSGIAGISEDGSLTLKGSSIELLGLDLASSSEICADTDGHAAPCDTSIARFLHDHSRRDQVKCWMEVDRAKVVSGRCSIDGSDLNAMLVHAGLARANRHSAPDYAELEAGARRARVGLWRAVDRRS